MKNRIRPLLLFAFILSWPLLQSCGSHKKTVSSHSKNTATEEPVYTSHDERTLAYINRFKDIAKKEMKNYKIPASITLAQAILESKSGQSRLAREANNHFGIKCGDDWTGKRLLHDDDHKNECFRVYRTPEESFRDHSKFLASKRRYAFLFRFPLTDYEAWAKGLQQAGYATDRSYPQKLIYLIEKYHLDKYDKEVLEEMKIKTPEVVEDTTQTDDKGEKIIYEVKAGETLFSIARKFGIPVREIKELNNLVDFDIYEGQILVLKIPEDQTTATEDSVQEAAAQITKQAAGQVEEDTTSQTAEEDQKTQPSAEVVKSIANIAPSTDETGRKIHTVKAGETLYAIARQYGVTVDDIRRANDLTGDQLAVGQQLIIPVKEQQNVQEPTQAEQTDTAPAGTPAYHIVQPGETLYRIHVMYGIPIERLRELNGLKDNTIYVGQKLKLR